jgi:hypothetical protein
MSEEPPFPSDTELQVFADKLGQFRGTLPPQEKELLDAMLLTIAGKEPEVQAYGLNSLAVKRAALVAVAALGLAVGGLSVPAVGAVQVAELAQQSPLRQLSPQEEWQERQRHEQEAALKFLEQRLP